MTDFLPRQPGLCSVSVCIGVFLLSIFFSGCGKPTEGPGGFSGTNGETPPIRIRHAEIQPRAPTAREDLGVAIDAEDPSGRIVDFRFQWIVNGRSIPGEEGPKLSRGRFKKGDTVRCRIVPWDGQREGPSYLTRPVIISNAPPVIDALRIAPEVLFKDSVAQLDVAAHDPDGDPVSLSIAWYVNGRLVLKDDPRLPLEGYGKFARIFARARAADSEMQGAWFQSQTEIIQNRPPVILSKPPGHWGIKSGFRYPIEALDPDGDALRIRVEGEMPPGMSWNEAARVLQWRPAGEIPGVFKLTIVVEDDSEGKATQILRLSTPS